MRPLQKAVQKLLFLMPELHNYTCFEWQPDSFGFNISNPSDKLLQKFIDIGSKEPHESVHEYEEDTICTIIIDGMEIYIVDAPLFELTTKEFLHGIKPETATSI